MSLVNPKGEGSLSGGPGSGSKSSSGGNPRRSLNAAFTLSPRPDSDDDLYEGSRAAVLVMEADKLIPPLHYVCDLASIEDRRVFVTQQCTSLAVNMTSGRIVESLLPALLTALECDDYNESFDNCAASIARVLPDLMIALDNKSVTNVACFMGLLMHLCCCAEGHVWRDTTAAFLKIIAMLADDVVISLFLPLVLEMRGCFWKTPRSVAAGLLGELAARPTVVQASGMTPAEWFSAYTEASRDPCVQVREAAVGALHQWVAVARVHRISFVEIPLPLVHEYITDDLSDTVRYRLIEELLPLARCVGREASTKYLQSVLLSACGDPSWRVRFVAAQTLGSFAALVANADDLVRVAVLLAEDEEPEIRSAVARQLPHVVEYVSHAVVERSVAPVVLRLSEDPNPLVRSRAVLCFGSLLLLSSEAVVDAVAQRMELLMQDSAFSVQVEAIRGLEAMVTSLMEGCRVAEARLSGPTAAVAATEPNTRRESFVSGAGLSGLSSVNAGGGSEPDCGTNMGTPTTHSTTTPQGRGGEVPHAGLPGLTSSSGSRLHRIKNNSCGIADSRSGRRSGGSTASPAPPPPPNPRGPPVAVAPGLATRPPPSLSAAAMQRRTQTLLTGFVGQLQILSNAGNWRLRDAVLQAICHLRPALSEADFAPLTHIIRMQLRDRVSAVRVRAVSTLEVVAAAYGAEWAAHVTADLLHGEFAPSQQVSYMWRVVAIDCLRVLLPVVAHLSARDLRRQHLLSISSDLLHQYTKDSVPNVRLAVANAMRRCHEWFAASSRELNVYNECVERLRRDNDDGVAAVARQIALLEVEDLGVRVDRSSPSSVPF